MKYTSLIALLASIAASAAQTTRIVSPTAGQRIVAGQQFTATVAFTPTLSSVNVIALAFGAKVVDTAEPTDSELGQTLLNITIAPQFTFQGPPPPVHQVNLTFPTSLITGLDREYNLTLGEFFTLGAVNTPLTSVDQVTLFIASS